MDEQGERPAKRRRKQYVSCDACRLRRVKCDRPGEEEDCRSCTDRGLRCTRDYVTQKATEKDSTKRLGETRRLYGDASPLLSISPSSEASSATPAFEFAFSSPEARIGEAQTAQLVVNSLVHCYRDKLLHRVPIMTDFEAFVSRFEDAGRTWTRLGQADRATSSLVMALAARVTDMPVIVGAKAPRLEDVVDAASDGYELTEFGESRHAVCRALEEKARRQVERTFMNSEFSIDAVAALMVMQMIDDTTCEVSKEQRPRVYSSTAIEHLRTLALRPSRSPSETAALEGPMTRGAILLDALWDGRPMQISDDDLLILYPSCFARLATSASAEIAQASPRECCVILGENLIMLSRNTRRRLGSPLRRGPRPRPGVEDFASCFAEGCLLVQAADLALSKVASPFAFVQAIRSAKIAFVCQLGVTLADGLAWWHVDTGGDEKAFSPLTETLETIGPIYISHLIDMCHVARQLHDQGMLVGCALFWTTAFFEAANTLLDEKTGVEGGHACLTHEVKVSCLDSLLRCLRQFSYSWPFKGHRSLEELEARFASFLTTSSVAASTMLDPLDPFASSWKSEPTTGIATATATAAAGGGLFDGELEDVLGGTWAFG